MTGAPYILWNGTDSQTYSIVIQKLPQFASAEERIDRIEVDGRDGCLYITNDSFGTYTTTCEMIMMDESKRASIFALYRGSGVLVSSENPSYGVRARVVGSIDPARVIPSVKAFVVTFECQPFLYEATPSTVTITESGNITNSGTRYSLPIIKVTGAGTLTIAGVAYTISATGGEAYVIINSEIEECYYGTANRNNKVTGGFPRLAPGVIAVVVGAGITKVEITGNWRWY